MDVVDTAVDKARPTTAFVIVRPGAVLDVSGAQAELDASGLAVPAGPARTAHIASRGGTIALGSHSGILLEGEMRAAGGTGAEGGHLMLMLNTPIYADNESRAGLVYRVMTITQERAAPWATPLIPDRIDPALFGRAAISAAQVRDGGFDNLTLWSRDVLRFDGNVDLRMGNSLALYRGIVANTGSGDAGHVSLRAPYVLIDGTIPATLPLEHQLYPGLVGWVPTKINRGRLQIDADLIDLRNWFFSGTEAQIPSGLPGTPKVDLAGFNDVVFNSRGDIRLGNGAAGTSGNMRLEAAQVYPMTMATFRLAAGLQTVDGKYERILDPFKTLAIASNGAAAPMPQSVFGTVSLTGGVVEQGGILRAPLGRIGLGAELYGPEDLTPTISSGTKDAAGVIRLLPGSETSVSAAGLAMPFGGTVDGLRYLYRGQPVAFSDMLALVDENGLITQGVAISTKRFEALPGAVLDLSGGGQLLGAGFASGRGGSVDILRAPLIDANPLNTFSAAGNKVYAIVPGYALPYAPVSPDSGAGAPAIGQ
jgi:hypothetical protein